MSWVEKNRKRGDVTRE